MKKEESKTPPKIIIANGRRKEATARVRLTEGGGEILINDKLSSLYFPQASFQAKLQKPFVLTKTEEKYQATVKVTGSGKSGQLDAVVHGIARALSQANPNLRSTLKKAGLLTRDPRVKERHKYGLAQKARKGKQSPKR